MKHLKTLWDGFLEGLLYLAVLFFVLLILFAFGVALMRDKLMD